MTATPHLTGLIVVIVIGAGALHAVWNAIAKQLDDRVMVFALMGIPLTLAGGLAVAVAGVPGRAAVAFDRVGRDPHRLRPGADELLPARLL